MTFSDLYNFPQDVINSLANAKVIFDIGAYDFSDSKKFLSLNPECVVYAFEASPGNYRSYSGHCANEIRLKTYNIAISDTNEPALFYDSGDDVNTRRFSGSLLLPTSKLKENKVFNFNEQGEYVPCFTVEKFCKENNISSIDFMHIDAQGAEYKIVSKIETILPKFIFAETCEYETYEDSHSKKYLDNLLASKGYTVLKEFTYDTLYGLTK